jgi:hypothetical protein
MPGYDGFLPYPGKEWVSEGPIPSAYLNSVSTKIPEIKSGYHCKRKNHQKRGGR